MLFQHFFCCFYSVSLSCICFLSSKPWEPYEYHDSVQTACKSFLLTPVFTSDDLGLHTQTKLPPPLPPPKRRRGGGGSLPWHLSDHRHHHHALPPVDQLPGGRGGNRGEKAGRKRGRCEKRKILLCRGQFEAVLRIHDILGWIRIRGSMPRTNGSGSWTGSFYFRHWPSRCQQKLIF